MLRYRLQTFLRNQSSSRSPSTAVADDDIPGSCCVILLGAGGVARDWLLLATGMNILRIPGTLARGRGGGCPSLSEESYIGGVRWGVWTPKRGMTVLSWLNCFLPIYTCMYLRTILIRQQHNRSYASVFCDTNPCYMYSLITSAICCVTFNFFWM